MGQLLRGLISPPAESHSRGYRQRLSRFVPSFLLSSNLRTYSEPYAECCLSSRSGCTGGNATVHRRFAHSERGGCCGPFSPHAAGGGSQNGLQTHAKQQGSPENHHHHRHPCRLPEAEPDTFNPTSLAPPIPHHWHRPTALPVPLGDNSPSGSPACLGPSSHHRDRETVQGGCRDDRGPPVTAQFGLKPDHCPHGPLTPLTLMASSVYVDHTQLVNPSVLNTANLSQPNDSVA